MKRVWTPGQAIGCDELWFDADYDKSGVHAFTQYERARDYAVLCKGILGEVYLWGRVIKHEIGFRAEYAYPKRFLESFCGDDSVQNQALLKSLHREYGLDV